MIRSNLLWTLALAVALAPSGCAADATQPNDERASAEQSSGDSEANEQGYVLERAAPALPTLLRSHAPESDEQVQYGPFPQPWSSNGK